LRQYLPKGIDLSAYSQSKLNAIAQRLNERPKKTLSYETRLNDFTNLLRRSVESAAKSGHMEAVSAQPDSSLTIGLR